MVERTTPADVAAFPRGARTRFAPAPTGFLHLGHVANAIWVLGRRRRDGWAGAPGEFQDHDRARSRPEYEVSLLEDLKWLGFAADDGPALAELDDDAPYVAALERLGAEVLVYSGAAHPSSPCPHVRVVVARARTPVARTGLSGRLPASRAGWSCPARRARGRFGALDGCHRRTVCGRGRRGSRRPSTRDRDGNWTYGFAVVVDDQRQAIGLVIRGRDLLPATPAQIRLARLLGRETPAVFAHHRLIRRPDGSKLSKADGDTSVRDLRAAGRSAANLNRRGCRGGRA